MANLVHHRPERPRIYQTMVGQLHKRKRIELLAQPAHRNAAPNSGGGESRFHIAEWRRRRHRPGCSQVRISGLIAIHGDAITAQQPIAISALTLAEEFKIKVPDLFDALHPAVR